MHDNNDQDTQIPITDDNNSDKEKFISDESNIDKLKKRINDLENKKEKYKNNNEDFLLLTKEEKNYHVFIFFILGLSTNLTTNSYFGCLDSFQFFLSKYSSIPVQIYLPSISCTMIFILVIFMYVKISINPIIIMFTCLFGIMINFIISPLLLMYVKKNIVMIICFQYLMHIIFDTLYEFSLHEFSFIFPRDLISKFTIGQGSAGICIYIVQILIKAFCVMIFKNNLSLISIWIIFGFFAFIFLMVTILFIFYLNNKFYQNKSKEHLDIQNEETTLHEEIEKNKEIYKILLEEEQKYFFDIIKKTFHFNITLFLTSLITYSCFPGIILYSSFFGISYLFKPCVLFLIFKILDIIGRQIPKIYFLNNVNEILYYVLCYSRLLLIPFFILDDYIDEKLANKFYSFVFLFLLIIFSISNGICTSMATVLSLAKINNEKYRGKIWAINAFFNLVGIAVGVGFSFLISYFVLIVAPSKREVDFKQK